LGDKGILPHLRVRSTTRNKRTKRKNKTIKTKKKKHTAPPEHRPRQKIKIKQIIECPLSKPPSTRIIECTLKKRYKLKL
jgi:hypothetical protein